MRRIGRAAPPIGSAALPLSGLRRHVLMLLVLLGSGAPVGAASIDDAWAGTYWGEPGNALLLHFAGRATVLPRPLDFGDSYVQIVRRDVMADRFPLIAFYQMDKMTGGLKRIQIERNRHGVNPPAFRAVAGELEAAYGAPDRMCEIAPGPTSGYQAASELDWRRGGAVIRAIFRDTTIEAFEGCLAGDVAAGPCGLTGQLLVRISPPEADLPRCPPLSRAR